MSEASPRPPRGPVPPIPFTLLTGFLGAGKTTLLNALLRDPALSDTLVIVNEFGDIGLDNLLVESVEEGMVTLAGGCLCCSVRSDLVDTLEDLLRRRDNGRIAPFRRIVVETSGLADPVPILQTLIAHPYLALRYALDGVVAVVDAITGAAALRDHEEARRQVAVADRLVLTKTDLLGDAESRSAAAELSQRLAELAPATPLLDAAKGEAIPAALFGLGPWAPENKIAAVSAWLSATDEGAEGAHRDDIRTTTIWSEAALPPTAFSLFIDLLRANQGPRILRLKGLVRATDDPDRPVVIHGVQHFFHPPVRLDAWPDEDHRTRIVLIGQGLDAAYVAQIYAAFSDALNADQPDRSALLDNPLAPPGLTSR